MFCTDVSWRRMSRKKKRVSTAPSCSYQLYPLPTVTQMQLFFHLASGLGTNKIDFYNIGIPLTIVNWRVEMMWRENRMKWYWNDMSWYEYNIDTWSILIYYTVYNNKSTVVLSVPMALSSFRRGDNHRSNVSSNPSNLACSNPGSNPASQTPGQKQLPKSCDFSEIPKAKSEIPKKQNCRKERWRCRGGRIVSQSFYQILGHFVWGFCQALQFSDHWYPSILLAYLPVIAKLPTFSSTGGGGSLVRASHEDIFADFQEKIWKFASHLLHPGTKTFIFKEDSHISLSNSANTNWWLPWCQSFRSSTHLLVNETNGSAYAECPHLFTPPPFCQQASHESSRPMTTDHGHTNSRSQLETSSRIWTRPYNKKTAGFWCKDSESLNHRNVSNSEWGLQIWIFKCFQFCQAAMCDDGLIKPGPQQAKAILCQ